ncbi:MAG: HAD family hydrolase, partial [Candidatus Aenigmarchaeota archaeon]|nr:HAD family hydrolase [Candidatus Aenigmarchaeota archaeon]
MMKAVIFDLDGTLVHTAPEYRYIVVGKVLHELGPPFSKKYIDEFWFGLDRDRIVEECFNLNPGVFWETYKKYDDPQYRKRFMELYDDVDFIYELKENGFKTGIVTSAPSRIINVEMEMLPLFDAAVRAQLSSGVNPKPHPDGLEKCLEIMKIENNEALYVGNGEEDILAAKSAGVLDVLIDRGEYEF